MVGTGGLRGRWWLYLILSIALILVVTPFVWMVLGAFKTSTELRQVPPTWWPEHPTTDNFTSLFSRLSFGTYFVNSTLVAVAVTAGNLLFCSMVGYALAMLKFRGKRLIFGLILATLMIPGVVTFVPCSCSSPTWGSSTRCPASSCRSWSARSACS
ncbi:carbohydrate ABC transporter permease [Tessaracoccus coleopterorum]|uniref:carbohydrate ABC transporter permease n=1 Tax=Tessaracoccus coleopterorum TaxID=2714950 RepID=UPI001E32236F|nr:carbohydrate ABC transporter permease [Tessaracoccus coleopterorum]